ncbi:MAG TPA: DinB family protein [Chitinophagaceae bacterium]|nr:DinB family protein [Chitinophagaceae bacterium]
MLSPSQKTRLQHQHESIIEITRGLTEEQLRVRPDTGKWSAFENIAHLAAYQPGFIERLKRIEKEESPLFERYVAENDPRFLECCEMDLHQLNEFLFTHRFLISNHIATLSEAGLRRIGRHPVYGELTVPKWVEFFLLHESHHLFTIFKLLNGSNR